MDNHDRYDDPIDPLTALERLLAMAGPAGVVAATDACRKIVRAYARQSSSISIPPERATETFREIVARAIPELTSSAREELVSTLGHTFEVWVRK